MGKFVNYPLSNAQKLIWQSQDLANDKPLFNMVYSFTFEFKIDPEKFKRAFEQIHRSTDALRTVFIEQDDKMVQQIVDKPESQHQFIDYSDCCEAKQKYNSFVGEQKRRIFNLSKCCFDSCLVKINENKFKWYFNQHHLITDAWSCKLIFDRLFMIYQDMEEQGENFIYSGQYFPKLSFEQTNKRTAISKTNQADLHWQKFIDHPLNTIELYGKSFQPNLSHSTRVEVNLNYKQTLALENWVENPQFRCISQSFSFFNLFLTLLSTLLSRLSIASRFCIGTPVHNRITTQELQSIGLFIELFPIEVEVTDNDTFISLYNRINRYSQLCLQNAHSGQSSALFLHKVNIIFNYIHGEFNDFNGGLTKVDWIHPNHIDATHALRVHVCRFIKDDPFKLYFDFNDDFVDHGLQKTISTQFTIILDAFIKQDDQKIAEINLANNNDYEFLLSKYNRIPKVRANKANSRSIESMFYHYVSQSPKSIAICENNLELTFEQLALRISQLSEKIISYTSGKPSKIGIYASRGINFIIATMAILKSGSAFVPIESYTGKKRIQFIVNDAKLKIIISQQDLNIHLADLSVEIILADHLVAHGKTLKKSRQFRHKNELAYIIYTSGSSGKPKGVKINHRSLSAYIRWAIEVYAKNEPLKFALFSNIGFDLTLTSVFLPLCSGGQIITYPRIGRDLDLRIIDVFKDDLVDVIKLTPSHLQLISKLKLKASKLKTLIVGGENFPTFLAKKILAIHGDDIEIFNEYGPTEATIGCMVHRYDIKVDQGHAIAIGEPAKHARVYLLDEGRNPLPMGLTGEIYIAGETLFAGYVNNPKLTKEVLIDDPFVSGQKMYRSGDLGKFNDQKQLVYLSRSDDQYKIQGVRIEKNEIEQAVISHPKIRSAYVKNLESLTPAKTDIFFCKRCVIPSNYPAIEFDLNGICNLCGDFEKYRSVAMAYFKDMATLKQRLEIQAKHKTGDYDCLMLFSGGKDSTYALYRLHGLGFKILAMTLDNGYISEQAKLNISKVTTNLHVDHQYVATKHMDTIFSDSIKRHCSVCYGCFKTIYTLAYDLAKQRGIPCIVTGLSRGQLFETRFSQQTFLEHGEDENKIEAEILAARKIYHRRSDAVSQALNKSLFNNDNIFEQILIIDFYRFCDTSVEGIYQFLTTHAPWSKPKDTGRSSNCLINDTGIYIHKLKKGYHNYVLPYSWDVRLNVKTRIQALREIHDELDINQIFHHLTKLKITDESYFSAKKNQLVVYYVSDKEIPVEEIRSFLSLYFEHSVIPRYFVKLSNLPLTANGKIDTSSLPDPRNRHLFTQNKNKKPLTTIQQLLCTLFQQILVTSDIGIEDNFFELGGDSIMAVQIAAKANQLGLSISTHQLFIHQTISQLSKVIEQKHGSKYRYEWVSGSAPLSPIQNWSCIHQGILINNFCHVITLKLSNLVNTKSLHHSIMKLLKHHDCLRHRLVVDNMERVQKVDANLPIIEINQTMSHSNSIKQCQKRLENKMVKSISVNDGVNIAVGVIDVIDKNCQFLLLMVNHLVIDIVSWQILLEDLDTLLSQHNANQTPLLPLKSSAYVEWVKHIEQFSRTTSFKKIIDKLPEPSDYHPIFNVERQNKRSNNIIQSSIVLNQMQAYELLHFSYNNFNIPIQHLLIAGLAMTMHNYCKRNRLCIDVEMHGRSSFNKNININRTIGWFAVINPLCLHLISSEQTHEFGSLLKLIKQRLNDSQYHFYRNFNSENFADENSITSGILFNYIGSLSDAKFNQFKIASSLKLLNREKISLKYPLELTAKLEDQQLIIHWVCDSKTEDESVFKRLLSKYEYYLHWIVKQNDLNSQKTLHQRFPLANLDQEKFDLIKKQLK